MITLGPLTVYSRGIFLLSAVGVSLYIFWREGVKRRYHSEELFDLFLLSVVGGLLGARLLYFLVTLDLTAANFGRLFALWRPHGMLWYGALLGGAAVGISWAEWRRFDLLEILDMAIPALSIGQAIGLLGVHPGESLFYFLLFLLLRSLPEKIAGSGFVLASYLTTSSLIRFGAEFFRPEKTFLFGSNFNAALSILFLSLGVLGLRQVLIRDTQERRKMLKKTIDNIKTTITWPREKFTDVRSRLRSEERHLRKHQEEMAREDPLLEPGRTVGNAELGDEASEEISHRESEAFRRVFRKRLRRVRHALHRLRSGKYGVCEECGKKIDPARLKVDPSITVCLSCQRKKELPR